jgi:hypothetical protein
MKFLKTLNLKKTHFVNGWANIDQVSHSQILELLSLGCYYNKFDGRVPVTLNILNNFKELMVFGKISDKGYMYFYGVTGFPFNSKCVEFCREISKRATISKIHHHSIYIEW